MSVAKDKGKNQRQSHLYGSKQPVLLLANNNLTAENRQSRNSYSYSEHQNRINKHLHASEDNFNTSSTAYKVFKK